MEAPNSVASETTTMTTIVVESIELHSISQLAPDAQVHHHETAPSYPVIDIAWTNVVSGMPTVAARSDVCEFEHATISNFLKGSKWSPDGTCLLTCSEDDMLRLYETPSDLISPGAALKALPHILRPALKINGGETVYDFAWYPHMQSSNASTSCFVSTARDHPLHLWDAFTGQIRCHYSAYDHMDQLTSAISVAFDNTGHKIYAGYDNCIRVFDTLRPGRDCRLLSTRQKKKRHMDPGIRGIVSCMSFSRASSIFAAGTYGREIGVYSTADESSLCGALRGHTGGITQVQFSPDGCYLYSGGRKDNHILCYDTRKWGEALHKYERLVSTNQRISFDLDSSGRYLITPSQDGSVLVYETATAKLLTKYQVSSDLDSSINSVQLHPFAPLLALSCGTRKFDLKLEEEHYEKESENRSVVQNENLTASADDESVSANPTPILFDNRKNATWIWQLPINS